MRAFTLCLAVSLVVSFPVIPLAAQTEQTPTNLTWLTLGLGGGQYRGYSATAALSEVTLQRGPHIFSLRALYMIYGSTFGAWDLAALYGRGHHGGTYHVAVSAGPSLVGAAGDTRTFGLALSANVSWIALRFFGIGLYGYANINTPDPFYGAMLALRFGKLR